jgi:hypothetical protein
MNRRLVHLSAGLLVALQMMPPSFAASQPELNFKIYSPDSQNATPAGNPVSGADAAQASGSSGALVPKTDDSVNAAGSKEAADSKTPGDSMWSTDGKAADNTNPSADASATTNAKADASSSTDTSETASQSGNSADGSNATTTVATKKTLKGYIRVVPSGTKIPIIMDTAVDSDTSQEGDEFSARTGEDLNIDGQTVVPAGSVIKGRIAQLNPPKNLGRSGSVALKFDTVTTPDNRQIPLVANLVARAGVIHAKRGLKDIALDTGTLAVPTVIGLGIGALAGGSSSSSSGSSSKISKPEAAMIGAGIGVAIGVAVLCIKKGKKVDVRPGDEMKIELAEDLRMPM